MPSPTFPFRFEIDRGFEHLGRNKVPQRYGRQPRRGGLKAAIRRFNAMWRMFSRDHDEGTGVRTLSVGPLLGLTHQNATHGTTIH
jgi:hypothetical protein